MAQNDVSKPSPAYDEMEKERVVCRDLGLGSVAIHAKRQTYLPKWEGEEPTEYTRRLKQAVLVNYFKQAVEATVDAVFSEPLIVEGLDARVEGWWKEDIDREGTSGDAFIRDVVADCVAEVCSGVFVDYFGNTAQSRREEAEGGARPYACHFRAKDLIEVLPVYDGGRRRAGRVRYRECRSEAAADGFGWNQVETVRVYRRGTGGAPFTYELHREGKAGFEIEQPETPIEPPGGAAGRFQDIALSLFYTGKTGYGRGRSVFHSLAELNISHYQKLSNKDTTLAVATVAAKHFAGFSDNEIKGVQWGPFRVIHSQNPEAKVHDIAHSPNSAQVAQEDLRELERQMAFASAEPKTSRATGQELATVRLADEMHRLSRLQAWALGWAASTRDMLVWFHSWLGLDGAQIQVTIKPDVFEALGSEPSFEDLLKMRAMNALSLQTLLEGAKRFNRLPETLDVKEEIQRIEAEGPRAPEPEDMPLEDEDVAGRMAAETAGVQ